MQLRGRVGLLDLRGASGGQLFCRPIKSFSM